MNAYEIINILDMIEIVGEDGVRSVLSDFFCPKNVEIERFIKENAIDFAKRKMSITYLVMDERGKLVAVFTKGSREKAHFVRGGMIAAECKHSFQAALDDRSGYLV